MARAISAADEKVAPRQFLAFRLAGRAYALPTDQVDEVIRLPVIARVPQAPAGLLGLANLRGAIVPVASGPELLGQTATPSHRAVVLQGASPVALAVDDVDGLVAADLREAETVGLLPGEMLKGAFQDVAGAVVKVLDIAPLLSAAFTARPRKTAIARAGTAQALAVAAAVKQTRLLTFEVAGQEYALPLDSVQEVADAPPIATAIPHAQSIVIGVTGFRDMLLPLLSLRGLLGLERTVAGGQKMVVTRVAGRIVGLVADRMTGLEAAPDIDIEPVPEILAARIAGESRIEAIYRAQGGRRLVPILSTKELFGEDVMRKLEAARKTEKAPEAVLPSAPTFQYVVFRLGDDEFGLPIDAVEEVLRLPEHVARIPKAPKFLEGVVNLRGAVLPVIDQRRRFGLPVKDSLAGRRLVVVRTQGHRAGLIVDSVSEVMRSREDEIDPAPAFAGEESPLVRGVMNLDDAQRLVLLLDPAELLTRTEQDLLEKFGRQVPEPPAT